MSKKCQHNLTTLQCSSKYLTLFKTRISPKCGNVMNLFEDIFANYDFLGGCGNSGIKMNVQITKLQSFLTNGQNPSYTHVKSTVLLEMLHCTIVLYTQHNMSVHCQPHST